MLLCCCFYIEIHAVECFPLFILLLIRQEQNKFHSQSSLKNILVDVGAAELTARIKIRLMVDDN